MAKPTPKKSRNQTVYEHSIEWISKENNILVRELKNLRRQIKVLQERDRIEQYELEFLIQPWDTETLRRRFNVKEQWLNKIIALDQSKVRAIREELIQIRLWRESIETATDI